MNQLIICVLLSVGWCSHASAQGGIITTVAGSGGIRPGDGGFSGDGGPATSALLQSANGVAVDASGNRFIADTFNNRIRRVSASGIITTVAGIGAPGFSGDGGAATTASVSFPFSIAVDASGNIFIAGSQRIRKVSVNGIITTVAGGGALGDGVAATSANLGNNPMGVAVDASGNIFIAVSGRIRKVSTNGIITTVAGGGSAYPGDGGPATSASLSQPYGIAGDASGNLFIADIGTNQVREVSAGGIITTVAGSGATGFSGDGGTAVSASLNRPYGVAVDASGNLFIADGYNNRIREVSAQNGIITTVAGGEQVRRAACSLSASGRISRSRMAVHIAGAWLHAQFKQRFSVLPVQPVRLGP